MRRVSYLAAIVGLLGGSASGQGERHGADPAEASALEGIRATERLRRLPIGFVENRGQWDARARFAARIEAMTVFLEDRGWTLALQERDDVAERIRGVAIRMTFEGKGASALAADDPLPGRHHYFLGRDPGNWRADVPRFRSVRFPSLRPGVDVRAREEGRRFEYDLLLEPRADLGTVAVMVEGARGLCIDGEGGLVLDTPLGEIRQPAPRTWETDARGRRRTIECRHVLLGNDRFGFEAPGRAPDRALVVDPVLEYSTFLGGTSFDYVQAVVVDATGAATVAGWTSSSAFPTTAGAFDTTYAASEAFVTRLTPAGDALVFSTFLGGSLGDQAWALAQDGSGGVVVAGRTASADFPTTAGAFDTTYAAAWDVFVARLSPSGGSLLYSTFLGGSGAEQARAIVVEAGGTAVVAGSTASATFPTTPGAFDTSHAPPPAPDAFVTRLDSSGSTLLDSTFLGGSGDEDSTSLAVDAAGVATIAGTTSSPDFPTTPGAYDIFLGAGTGTATDGFVARLPLPGTALLFSTYLGGTAMDMVLGMRVAGDGTTTTAGSTNSPDFPTTPGAFDSTFGGGGQYGSITDGFVTRLTASGGGLVFSTYLGGSEVDEAHHLELGAGGTTIVVGRTQSPNFPTTAGAFDPTYNQTTDAFLARLAPTGASLLFSTFLGGSAYDAPGGASLSPGGGVAVAGTTVSADFPVTAGAFDTTHGGANDGFVADLDLLPPGASVYGNSTPGCSGLLPIGVTSAPQVGNPAFVVTCDNAPPNTTDFLGVSGAPLASPPVFLGAEIWIDLASNFFVLYAPSNGNGESVIPLPIPADPLLAGGQLFFQFFWSNPCVALGLCASNALAVTVQP